MTDSCATCIFTKGTEQKGPAGTHITTYVCRRGPPMPDATRQTITGEALGIWPAVGAEDWCGEHRGPL